MNNNVIFEDVSCGGVVILAAIIAALVARTVYRVCKAGPTQYKWTAIDVGLLSIGIVGLFCVLYGFFVEPNKLELTYTKIASPKIPAGKTIRLVQLSDLHCDGVVRTEDRLPDVVAAQHPDVLLFCGDCANNKAGAKQFARCMSKLAQVPTFAVFGNHDSHFGWAWHPYEGVHGATILAAGAQPVTVAGTTLWISGVGIDNEQQMPAVLASAPKDRFSIFLYHYPAGIKLASRYGIDLMCAGHTHGGQICLPLYGPVTTQSTLGRAFAAGLFRFKHTWLYITRGIGMTGIPARFLCPPEVTVIDLVHGEDPGPSG